MTVGVGSAAFREERVESAWVEAGANDAEASPAMATTRAKARMATFIFGNLSQFDLKVDFPLSGEKCTLFFYTSPSFSYIYQNNTVLDY